MKITIAGCGDAFGSGGRLQSCYHLETAGGRGLLLDCGASATIGMERAGLDPAGVDTIVISHLHGDHFSGLVWWLLRAVYVERRTTPLLVAGPAGIEARFWTVVEALYPGMTGQPRPFALQFRDLTGGVRTKVGPAQVTPFEVIHPSGAPSFALRVEIDGQIIAYSGDTEWTEALVACASDADIFICECFGYTEMIRNHMYWRDLSARLARLRARRLLLTHLGPAMLRHVHEAREVGVEIAEDGLVVEL